MLYLFHGTAPWRGVLISSCVDYTTRCPNEFCDILSHLAGCFLIQRLSHPGLDLALLDILQRNYMRPLEHNNDSLPRRISQDCPPARNVRTLFTHIRTAIPYRRFSWQASRGMILPIRTYSTHHTGHLVAWRYSCTEGPTDDCGSALPSVSTGLRRIVFCRTNESQKHQVGPCSTW